MDSNLALHVPKVGFCKLWGDGIEHYAKKYEIVIGRRSKTTVLDVVIGEAGVEIFRECTTYA